jgi:hypothetical protein
MACEIPSIMGNVPLDLPVCLVEVGSDNRPMAKVEGQKTRRYFVDACHPVWGVEMCRPT